MVLQIVDGHTTGQLGWAATAGGALAYAAGPAANTRCVSGAGAPGITYPLPSAAATCIAGAFCYNDGSSWGSTTAGSQFIEFLGDAGAVQHLCVKVTADGHIEARRGGPNGTILATSTYVLTANQWHHWELKGTIADAGGICILRIDGVEVLNFTGDTRNGGTLATVSSVRFGSNAGGSKWTSIVIMDGTGTDHNDFIGERVIRRGNPDGAGATTGLTPSAGVNWQNVDEDPWAAAGTDYNSASGVAKDTYTHSDVSGFSSVDAVRVILYALKTDAGARTVRTVMRSSIGTENDGGADLALSTTVGVVTGPIRTTTPDGAALTQTNVNSSEYGVKVA